MSKGESSERRWVLVWAAVIVLLSSVPYIFGLAVTPHGSHFVGFTHNMDDGAVYLSWMRQAADGHFFIRNLFTNQPQAARTFNVFFLIMGWIAGLTHLPLAIVWHLFRVGLGFGVIIAVWKFSKLFLESPQQRRLLIPIVGLCSGLGWLIPGPKQPVGPVDEWQPEAITFLSVYLNPLFLVGMLLMLGAFYYLVKAERGGGLKHAAYAGICLLLLGNIHTYDVLTVVSVWAVYCAIKFILGTDRVANMLRIGAVAGLIAAPSIAYQFWLYSSDPVFRARANSATESPAIWAFFAGYGLILVGAVIGAVIWWRRTRGDSQSPGLQPQLLIVWSVVGFALPYLPVGQQRKLVMGLHIPLCILCAYAVSELLKRAPRALSLALIPALFIVSIGSSVRFLAGDMLLLSVNKTPPNYPAYISAADLGAIRYLRTHASVSETILAPPQISLLTPALAGRQVYYGHWSETPDFAGKINEWAAVAVADVGQYVRAAAVAQSGADYYVGGTRDELRVTREFPRVFRRVFQAGSESVFRVDKDALDDAGPPSSQNSPEKLQKDG